MSEPEEKERHARKRKKNILAKIMRTGDNKGAFALKIVNPKKGNYKREKVDIKKIEVEFDDE